MVFGEGSNKRLSYIDDRLLQIAKSRFAEHFNSHQMLEKVFCTSEPNHYNLASEEADADVLYSSC